VLTIAHYGVYCKKKILKYPVVWLDLFSLKCPVCYNTHSVSLLLPGAEGKDQTKHQFPLYRLLQKQKLLPYFFKYNQLGWDSSL